MLCEEGDWWGWRVEQMSSLTSKAAQKELGLVINDRGLTAAVIPLTVTDETAF